MPSREPSPDHRPRGTPEPIGPRDSPAKRLALTRQREAAEILARNGYDVEQGPTVPGTKKPDYRIEGEIFDCKAPTTDRARNIADRMERAIERGQANRFVLNLDDSPVDLGGLRRQLSNWPIDGLEEVLAVRRGQVISFFP